MSDPTFTWTKSLDRSGPAGHLIRSEVDLRIVTDANGEWDSGATGAGYALPSLNLVGLGDCHFVQLEEEIFDFGGTIGAYLVKIDRTVSPLVIHLYDLSTAAPITKASLAATAFANVDKTMRLHLIGTYG